MAVVVAVVESGSWTGKRRRMEGGGVIVLLVLPLLLLMVVRGVGEAASALARLRSTGSWRWVGKAPRS